MNFLSHYYLDKDHPSAYFKFGAVLPDLLKGYNQILRKGVANYAPTLPEHIALKQGAAQHHLVDNLFHILPVFDMLQAELKQELKHLDLLDTLPRYWFLVHIAVEMLIDRNLLKLYPHLYVEFYDSLAVVSQPIVEKYFAQTGGETISRDFFGNFKVFTERRFLQYYPSDEQFTETLLMAWYRATGNKVGAAVQYKTQMALLNFEERHASLLETIPKLVAQELKNAT